MKTKKHLQLYWGWDHKKINFPPGTPVRPATNLPDNHLFWIDPQPDWSAEIASWAHTYGFLVRASEVTE